jgi:hypothetical protein
MSDLFPTPTRLALLAEVEAGLVTGSPAAGVLVWRGPGIHRRVTAAMVELQRAGWVDVVHGEWWPTATGRAVLDQHRRAET